jgi:signal transduction histidine kinase
MKPFDSQRRTRTLQMGFLVLLVTCSAQLTWWLIDQWTDARRVQEQRVEGQEHAARAARVMLDAGVSRETVTHLYPTLRIVDDRFDVDPRVLAAFAEERWSRVNQYAWEGAFFLAVLMGSMAVVLRALRSQTELNRRQENFLATVSHELKSPLSSLQLSAETLALRDPPVEQRLALIDRLLEDLARLERLIGNILDTSRLSEPAMRTNPEAVPMAAMVESAIAEVAALAAEQQTTLVHDVPPGVVVRADAEGVRTVLRNLLDNAVRATVNGRILVTARADGARVRLDVQDDGAGFTPELAERLFDKFYRPDANTRAQRRGTGLGLYLVHRYVELDGGTVHAHSDGPGRGAKFTVIWPSGAEARNG